MPAADVPGTTVITVDVVHAEADRALCKTYRLSAPATVGDAVRRAAADPDFSGCDVASAAVGVFGKAAALTQPVQDGDRVELYRPLATDPKTARRARVERARQRR